MYNIPNQNYYSMAGYYPPQSQFTGLKGRPVSSLEEARAANIDFDGSLFIFPDVVNRHIYTKQINLDGTASMKDYALIENPPSTQTYVTKEEFDSVIKNLGLSFNKEEKVNESNTSKTSRNSNITF